MAAGGYPNDYASGAAISGIDDADALGANTMGKVFHGGTRLNDGQVETSGGRVLGVTAMGDSVQQAQFQAYAMVKKIQFDKAQYRSDIGYRAIARELSD
jgi:phosphoribosylamine--glycine ligase